MKNAIVFTALLGLGVSNLAMADQTGSLEQHLEKRGERIDQRLDQRGEKYNYRLDQKSNWAASKGYENYAEHLDTKGDRVANRFDRRGDSYEHHFEQRAQQMKRIQNRNGQFSQNTNGQFSQYRQNVQARHNR